MTTREEFITALNKLASSGNVNALANAYSNAAIPQDKQDIEPFLIAGIEVCERYGLVNDVAGLLGRTDLSDTVMVAGIEVCGRDGRIEEVVDLLERTDLSVTVMIAGIKVCGREGWVDTVARLLERTDLSDAVKQQIETSFVTGIGVCGTGRFDKIDKIADLLKRTDLSDTVMIAGIEICGREGWIYDIVRLLKRTDLSDTIRQAARKAVTQSRTTAALTTDATLSDVVRGYLQGREGNPLARGGVISKGTIRPPEGIAPANSKPGTVTV